jgi:hypothetical protein
MLEAPTPEKRLVLAAKRFLSVLASRSLDERLSRIEEELASLRETLESRDEVGARTD